MHLHALGKGHVTGVHPITTAKVPILKVVDRGTGVECDLSIENRDGILKSRLIHMFCSIDERFRKLSFLVMVDNHCCEFIHLHVYTHMHAHMSGA